MSHRYCPYDAKTVCMLLEWIYSKIGNNKQAYTILDNESKLKLLDSGKYYVSGNIRGIQSYLIFTRQYNRYFTFCIDKKDLTPNINDIDINNIHINTQRIRLDDKIHDGSILEGVFIMNKRTRERVFVVTDLHWFRGNDVRNDTLDNKMLNISTYLDNMKIDGTNNIKLMTNKLFELKDVREVKTYVDNIKVFEGKGLVFYPETSTIGNKLIFLGESVAPQTKEDIELKIDPNTIDIPSIKPKKETKYITTTGKDIEAVLEMRKTDQPDVYLLFAVINDNNNIKLKKIGIALVPDSNTSKLCNDIINSKKYGRALVLCRFAVNKNGWIPCSEKKDAKMPTDYILIEKQLIKN